MKPIRTLKVSISGIRGVVGDSLKPLLVCRFAQAFSQYLGRGSVLVGRDTRTSGEMVKHAVLAGLLSSGARVVDVDICPVPTIQLTVRKLHCKGGIAVTASHNPEEWNALKFIKSSGCFLNRYEAEELLSLYHQQSFTEVGCSELQGLEPYRNAVKDHLEVLFEKLRPRSSPPLKVVIDCCNGAGSIMAPRLLELLGCQVVPLNCAPDGRFPRNPEPIPANLNDLCAAVLREKADLGFAQDADADRLAVVSEEGVAIGEEYTLALCARHILSRTPGSVVVNLSTSRMVDAIASRFGSAVYRSKIGEVNVTEMMEEKKAILGGEGNGGVIYPAVNLARDSFVAITVIVDMLRSEGKTVSRILRELPQHRMMKFAYKIHPHLIPDLTERLISTYSSENPNLVDGIKVERDKGWFHVRGSNTEPIVRLVIEADDQETLEQYHREVQLHLRGFLEKHG